jgi:fructuronate reductase
MLGDVPAGVERFVYDRAAQACGIVHFGIGAFHRAHQAWYTDAAMNGGERDWMITGVSLRSAGVAEQMNPQDGLYTLAEQSGAGTQLRIVGSVREVLVARRDAEAIVAALAAPAVQIVSFTVTEKGYCRAADGALDLDQAEASVYPLLAAGLARRHDAGLPGVTLLSCDNLADNGRQLARLFGEYLEAKHPALRGWFDADCACPATMIDRIVPATTDDDRALVAAGLGGLDDEAAVVTEPFSQWIVEDRFAGPRPAWDRVGAELVDDVAPYETAKLRMLNGAHSALAYLGLERGHTYVHQAVGDPSLRPLIERLMRQEAAPSFTAAPGQDLRAYADALLARFDNPALNHRLIQIAMDGSQKIPQRWLATLIDQRAAGQTCPSILAALGAWIRRARGPMDDPATEALQGAWRDGDFAAAAHAILAPQGPLNSAWQPSDGELAALQGD